MGGIKIGAFSQGDTPFVEIPDEFDQLNADFFSLGTDESFYSNLARDLPEHREQILTGLNDIAFNKERLKKALSTNVFKTALSRYVSLSSISGRFHRLAMGDAELTRSMSKRGSAFDNAQAESFFGHLKMEFFYNRDSRGTSKEEFISGLDSYIEWYNTKRRKNSLGGKSSKEYRHIKAM